MTKKSNKSKTSPDKLAKTGKSSGVQLSEAELGKAAGGYPLKYKIT